MPYEMRLEYSPGKENPTDNISRHPTGKPPTVKLADDFIKYVPNNAIPKSMALEEVREAKDQQSTP